MESKKILKIDPDMRIVCSQSEVRGCHFEADCERRSVNDTRTLSYTHVHLLLNVYPKIINGGLFCVLFC